MSRDAAMALLDGLHQQGITVVLRKGRLGFLPGTLYKTLTEETRFGIYEHREAIKTLVREGYQPAPAPAAPAVPQTAPAAPQATRPAPAPTAPQVSQQPLQAAAAPAPATALHRPQARVEPEPEVYAYHHRVTDRDVRKAMQAMGDEMLDAYITGRLSKAEAYEMTRHGLMHVMEMPS